MGPFKSIKFRIGYWLFLGKHLLKNGIKVSPQPSDIRHSLKVKVKEVKGTERMTSNGRPEVGLIGVEQIRDFSL